MPCFSAVLKGDVLLHLAAEFLNEIFDLSLFVAVQVALNDEGLPREALVESLGNEAGGRSQIQNVFEGLFQSTSQAAVIFVHNFPHSRAQLV